MAEEKTFRYGFIMLGFFLVMTGMFIMSVEKPHIYITFCVLGVLLVAVGITWSMCQCYPKVRSVLPRCILGGSKAQLALGDSGCFGCVALGCASATSTYEKNLLSHEQIQRQAVGSAPLPPMAQPRPRSWSQPAMQARVEVHRELGAAGEPPRETIPQLEKASGSCPHRPVPGDAPLASLLEDMDTPSLEGSVPSSPVPPGRPSPPSASRSSCTPTSSPTRGGHPSSPRKGTGEEDDLYYGLREGPDALLEDSDCLFEPEN
ncbi:BSND protein, partial [Chordeiles acutipennis]|nr:BSND protein [Chordeiles acutipennis]